jgi:hypothetical protein
MEELAMENPMDSKNKSPGMTSNQSMEQINWEKVGKIYKPESAI